MIGEKGICSEHQVFTWSLKKGVTLGRAGKKGKQVRRHTLELNGWLCLSEEEHSSCFMVGDNGRGSLPYALTHSWPLLL